MAAFDVLTDAIFALSGWHCASDLRGSQKDFDIASIRRPPASAPARTESGGPKVKPPMGAGGYGSKFVERSVTGHLRGSIVYDLG